MQKNDRSAYTVIKMLSRTRAGKSNRYAILLLLPGNPEPLPSACPDQARQNVRDFIDHQPHYRYARSKVPTPASRVRLAR